MDARVFELRQYTLHPGQREVLIDVFEREFVESQEAVGMQIVGQFRDMDRPNRFVWLRGFSDMSARHRALRSFYGGPVWAEHKDVANATMVDSDDVLLLRPLAPATSFQLSGDPRPQPGCGGRARSLITATVYRFAEPPGPEIVQEFAGRVDALLSATGAPRVALLATETAENTFTALPVREGEHVLVRFARFADAAERTAHLRRLHRATDWRSAQDQLCLYLAAPVQELRLRPTGRSLLR